MSSTETVRRSGRKIQTKSEPYQTPESSVKYHKWTDEEQQTILYCLKVFGHKDIDRISKHLPCKSKEEIRRFLLLAHTQARKKDATIPGIKYWLDRCKGEMNKADNVKSNYMYMPGQVIKYLAVNGLLEKHPKPENCGNIDFAAAYKLIYQALMGYPLQPVNQATADFICECLNEISVMRNQSLVSDLSKMIEDKCKEKNETNATCGTVTNSDNVNENSDRPLQFNKKKPVIVYKRKRPVPVPANSTNAPPLQIVFEEKDGKNASGNTKCYSLAIGGKNEASPLIVPIPVTVTETELEKAASNLWSNPEFNPLELPDELSKRHPR